MDKSGLVLDIPNYYNNLFNNIASENIHKLLNSDPIEYMRDLYENDINLFYLLRDELILRGIGFDNEYQNNYLLGRNYKIHTIILKTENNNSYKNINFTMHGSSNFINRFKVNSDLFFHNVPWEGLLYFLPNASPDYLKREFKKHGFSFTPVENYDAVPLIGNNNCDYSNGEKIHIKETEENYDVGSAYDYTKLNLPIEHYFGESKFNHFVNYCNKNNVYLFSDLTLDTIEEYSKQKYARENTLELIKRKFHNIYRTFNPLPYVLGETIDQLYNNRLKILCDIADVSYLELLDDFYNNENVYEDSFPIDKIQQFCTYVNENIEQIIEKNKQKKKQEQFRLLVSEINNHPNFKYLLSNSIQDLANLLSLNNEGLPNERLYLYDILEDIDFTSFLEKILIVLNSMVDLKETVITTISKLNPREREVIELRESMTLQEVGDIIGVTRERVRQIEAKANNYIVYHGGRSQIEIFFKYYTEHSKLVSIDEFCDAFNITDPLGKIIIKKFLTSKKQIRYLDSINRYMYFEDYEVISDSLDKIDLNEPIIKVEDLRQLIPKEVIHELQEVMDMLITSRGYLRVHNLYVKENISIIERIEYLFQHKITKPLRMDDEGYKYFMELMNTTFGIPYTSSKRAATARIADGDNVILVDSNTYFRHEEEKITEEFLASLEEAINIHLTTRPYADPRDIYFNYKDLMETSEIKSPVHLYSIIQIYLGDKYETRHGNTLYIFKPNVSALDSESILLNYLVNNGHEVSYQKVLTDLNWKAPKLDQLLQRSQKAIMINGKIIKTIESFEFTEEELSELRNIIMQEFEKGYVFTEDLAFELAFKGKLKSLIHRTDISNITTLSATIKWLFDDVYGYPRMLYKSTSSIQSLEEALASHFPEIATRAELLEFTREKGYSEQKIATIPSSIVEEGLFFPYTSTQFINAKEINFTKEVQDSLKVYLDRQLEAKPYKSVFSMVGYSQELLPISKFNWTEWLIHHLAQKIGYRKVFAFNQDYRYDKLLLVKADSGIETLEDLVYYIAKTEYQGRTHEEDFAKYLASINIIHNPRSLSSEIYNSNFFEFDSFGFFQLR